MKTRMNKIFASLLILPLSISCGWLDVAPENTVDEEDLFSTGWGCRNSLNGIYLKLGTADVYGENLSWGFLSAAAQEYLTDNSLQGSYSVQLSKDAADFVYNSVSTRPVIASIWETSYSIIANINNIIKHIDDIPKTEFAYGEEERALIKSEAYALRAMVHFDLLRLFAPAPATSPSGTYIPYREEFSPEIGEKLTVGKFLEKVLLDIQKAEAGLRLMDTEYHPEAMYASMVNDPTPNWCARYRFDSRTYLDDMGQFFWYRGWRMNYLALLALKARVCLYAGPAYYANARAAALELYNDYYNGKRWVGFTPSDNITCQSDVRYFKLSDDVLFGAYRRNLATDYDSGLYGNDNNVRYPLANVESLFASDNTGLYDDYRLRYTIKTTNSSNRAYYSGKYSVSAEPVVETVENPMIPVIRFSEVCYILAELCASNGNISEGVRYLEQVRTARGALRSLSSVTTAEQLLEEIILDARKDFLCEGQTFFMYKRLNIASAPSSSVPGGLRDMQPGYVLPVPTSENPF